MFLIGQSMNKSSFDIDSLQSREIQDLKSKIGLLEVEMAERRSLGEVVKFSGLMIVFVGGVLSFFGFSSFREIQSRISEEVDVEVRSQILSNVVATEETLSDFYQFVENNENNMQEFNALLVAYEERLKTIDEVIAVDQLQDVEGEIARLTNEIRFRASRPPDFGSPTPFTSTLFEKNWRLGVVTRILEVSSNQNAIAQLDADKWFNFIMLLRETGFDSPAQSLVSALPLDSARPDFLAMNLSMRSLRQTGEMREKTLNSLFDMVSDVNERSPHIVIAEAWNAAESYRRYSDLIVAIEKAIKRRASKDLPEISYLHIILSESYLRRGFPGDLKLAEDALADGLVVLVEESPYNQWHGSATEKARELRNLLERR